MIPRIITEEQVRSAVPLDAAAIAVVEAAFAKLARGGVVMPPVQQILVDDHHGQTCIKSAYSTGDPFFVVKAASTFRDNCAKGLSNTSGLILVLEAETGFIDSIILDNGYLTATRTAAAGAVAAKWLSQPTAERAAILGAGKQARLQLFALGLVRPLRAASVWAPRMQAARAFAREASGALNIPVTPFESVQECVRDADLIVTTTPARAPILNVEWVRPGTHITAVGSDAPGKVELSPQLVAQSAIYVCDSREQCRVLGELRHALACGVVPPDARPVELGEIITGQVRFERRPGDVTICDLTGLGIQDAEIAVLAQARSSDQSLGTQS